MIDWKTTSKVLCEADEKNETLTELEARLALALSEAIMQNLDREQRLDRALKLLGDLIKIHFDQHMPHAQRDGFFAQAMKFYNKEVGRNRQDP